MVNVEADALAGPLLARARARGGHRLFARVRRPARADLRDGRLGARGRLRGRRRRQGHEVPARVPRVDARHGVGPLRLHAPRQSRAATSTRRCSIRSSTARSRAIEMAAVANATGLTPAPDGLAFPPCGVDDLPRVLRPRDAGGALASPRAGRSGLEPRARRPPVFRDLRWGVYVTFARASSDYVRRCFRRVRARHRRQRASTRRCTSRIT